MPDKVRPIILALADAGLLEEAQLLLYEENAKWHAMSQELGERTILGLIAENIACECGKCGTPTPREYIYAILLMAVGEIPKARSVGRN